MHGSEILWCLVDSAVRTNCGSLWCRVGIELQWEWCDGIECATMHDVNDGLRTFDQDWTQA
jgi:hypothetical protein